MEPLARVLIVAGAVLFIAGVLLTVLPNVPWIGRLPGDIRIERPNFRLYAPLTTSLIISLVLSFLLWLTGRWRG